MMRKKTTPLLTEIGVRIEENSKSALKFTLGKIPFETYTQVIFVLWDILLRQFSVICIKLNKIIMQASTVRVRGYVI